IHEFGFRLYYYKRFLQKQKVDNLEYFSHIPPILDGTDVFLPEIFKDGDFDYVGWLHETRFQSEQKPVVRFLFRDNKTGQTQWLHEEDTRSLYETGSLFIERVILAIDIADTGAGYAPDSLATYQSDKPFTHQRGKFGEGAKLAEFELSRAQMLQVNTSVYQTADKTVGWYARPHTTPEGIVEILGKKVSVERVEGQKTGSSTRIVFKPEKDAKERTSQDDKRSLIAYFLNTTAEGKLPIRADERAQFKYSPEVLLGLQPLCAGGYICTGPRC
ncbi:MAG TPA: hypothetical protein VEA59_05375, partial [Patescibacteria group bacterium]|nr:hypothetical protein [Patescibacteria group bacterium]